MKKRFLFLVSLFLGLHLTAQNNVCPNAIPISNLNNCFLADVKDTVSWFSFTASQTQQQVLISNHIAGTSPTSGDLIIFLQRLTIYSGLCNSLQVVESKNVSSGSTIINRNDFVSGNVYYIKVSHQFINGNHFDLCFHQKVGESTQGNPTCELICNGNFEDSSGCVDYVGAMFQTKCWDKIAFMGDTTDIQDLNQIFNNTKGSPDYFNSNYNNGTCSPACLTMSVDVPQNSYNTAPVPSYSGPNAYAGIISYRSDAVTPSPTAPFLSLITLGSIFSNNFINLCREAVNTG
jgi:hypothetical protein